jgi:hypothetical protein
MPCLLALDITPWLVVAPERPRLNREHSIMARANSFILRAQ